MVTTITAFWQLKPLIPRYYGMYDISIILIFIESLGQNETLTLKPLSEKTAFLVVFLTLYRYCLGLTLDQIYLSIFFIISPLPDCPTQNEQFIGLGDGDS